MLIFDQKIKGYAFSLSGGDKSGIEMVQIIKKLANIYKKNVVIRSLTANLVRDLPSFDYYNEVKTVYEWVRDNIRYLKDIKSCETLQIPTVTLPIYYSDQGLGQGDCDDHVLLLASMLLSIGAKDLKMRIVKYSLSVKEWQHIYLVWKYKGREYPMDAIKKFGYFGWEVKHKLKKDIPL